MKVIKATALFLVLSLGFSSITRVQARENKKYYAGGTVVTILAGVGLAIYLQDVEEECKSRGITSSVDIFKAKVNALFSKVSGKKKEKTQSLKKQG